MSWQSIAIISIMALSTIYNVRTFYMIRETQVDMDKADHEKDDKIARLKSNIRTWGVVVFFVIFILFISDLLK